MCNAKPAARLAPPVAFSPAGLRLLVLTGEHPRRVFSNQSRGIVEANKNMVGNSLLVSYFFSPVLGAAQQDLQ